MPARSEHVVIVGSAPVTPAQLHHLSADATALICADGGAGAVLDAGLLPALVVGDMDSLSSPARERLVAAGVPLIEHPPQKNQTDLELALDQALSYEPRRITIAGALGGRRFDHALGNVLLLTIPSLAEIDARIVDAQTELLVVWSERSVQGVPGEYVSLIPLSPLVEGVRTTGMRYPLHDESLLQGYTRGISNELIADRATVLVRRGCLLLVHERLRAGDA